jgi:hypothetical protein
MSAIRSPAVRPLAQDAREKHARHSRADLTVVIPLAISRVRVTSLRSVPIDETADQPGKRLMLGARFASSEKVSELNRGHLAAGRNIGFVQNKGPTVIGSAQQPTITIFAGVNFSLAVRHLEALQETIDRDPDSFPNAAG